MKTAMTFTFELAAVQQMIANRASAILSEEACQAGLEIKPEMVEPVYVNDPAHRLVGFQIRLDQGN